MPERNKTAPSGLFFMLFISRSVVCLSDIRSITLGTVTTDLLISFILSLGFTLIFSLPIIFCIKTNKNPFDIEWLGYLYFLFFIFTSGINLSRFSYFASTTVSPDTQAWIFGLLATLCAFYCACLGIEALSRFSAFAFMIVILAVITIFLCNIEQFSEINLYPIVTNSKATVFENSLIFASNSVEMAMLLCLREKINGVAIKSYVSSVIASYLSVFILLLVMFGVLGDASQISNFPLYSLFQMSKIGSFERLDILLISFWIVAVFVKAVLTVYCASISIKKFKNRNKCFAASVGAFAVSLLIQLFLTDNGAELLISISAFFVFCVLIPLLTLIFKKKNRGEELVKKF